MKTALDNWKSLNDFLREATEAQCGELLTKEREGKQRTQFLLRIQARNNVLRAQRERSELLGKKASAK